jgi:hypothetical protein
MAVALGPVYGMAMGLGDRRLLSLLAQPWLVWQTYKNQLNIHNGRRLAGNKYRGWLKRLSCRVCQRYKKIFQQYIVRGSK